MIDQIQHSIEKQKARIVAIDEKIGRLMSQRVGMEEKLAVMYSKRNRGTPLAEALKTIMAPEFGS